MTALSPMPVPTSVKSGAALLSREDPILSLPILILCPHSRCNCRCKMCDIWRAKERNEIASDEISAWMPEWKKLGISRVVLSGGEALLHSHLWDLCALLRDEDIGITLLTTGLLLEKEAAHIVQYCDDVIVSLDGPREIHNRVRNIPTAFDKMARGIAAIKSTGASISISGRCTIQLTNYRYIRETVLAAKEMGLDRISFLAADVSSEAFNRPEGWDKDRVSEVALSRADLPLLKEELEFLELEFSEEFENGFIAESPEKLRRRLLQYFSAITGAAEFFPNNCNAPWVSTVIESDGMVRPCFFQPPLGNIRESGSLDAVLNSPEAIAFRKNLNIHTDPICSKCVCTLALRT